MFIDVEYWKTHPDFYKNDSILSHLFGDVSAIWLGFEALNELN